MSHDRHQLSPARDIMTAHNKTLVLLGSMQLAIYVAITMFSSRFALDSPETERPLAMVLSLLWTAFACYLLSYWLVRSDRSRACLYTIATFAFLFRFVMIWSQPIQEVDIYRYLWDGRVTQAGVNPFRYSPEEIEFAERAADVPEDLARSSELRQASPAVAEIFARIHYREVPTVYPPASQLVFACAAWLTPIAAEFSTHVLVLKAVLLLFDLGTFLLLARLLSRLNMPMSLSLLYCWCPLVIKEFANSGHLDSIAVFFTVATIWLLLPPCSKAETGTARQPLWRSCLAAVFWAVSVLAKCYPIVLGPVLTSWLWRRHRWSAVVPLTVFATAVVTGYIPFRSGERASDTAGNEMASSNHDAFEGLRTFLTRWEMNDLIFNVLSANLGPDYEGLPRPWYVFVPASQRFALDSQLRTLLSRVGIDESTVDAPFLFTHVMLGSLLIAICGFIALNRWQDDEAELPRRVFYCLAWMWYLSATQNPWYWTWALPFLPFIRGPWLLTSGMALAYYLRFWFEYQFPSPPVFGTHYDGTQFFDYVVVWLEHLPVLVMVPVCWCVRRKKETPR